MEFFATLNSPATQQDLQQQLRLETLPRFCASIYELVGHAREQAEVNMVWGLFDIHRECIRGGVRFTLPNCLNGVAWTVTVNLDDSADEVTIHCTINRRQQDADFVESLEEFVQDWRKGLAEHLQASSGVDDICCA